MTDPSHATTLSTEQTDEFVRVAKLLGHDVERLLAGEQITSYFQVATLEEARTIFSRASVAQRKRRGDTFFQGMEARLRLGQGIHDRAEAAVLASEGLEISESDRIGIDRHFPIHMKAVSVMNKILAPAQQWDISVRGEHWDLPDSEDLFVVLNTGVVTFSPFSGILVRGNVFSLLMQRFCDKGKLDTNSKIFHIGILPTPFSQDSRTSPLNGKHGANGQSGTKGADGEEILVERSVLGYCLLDESVPVNNNGSHGEDGKDGKDGHRGRNGGPCKIAEITLRQLDNDIRIFCQAQNGGRGGDGGKGGDGGFGGDGRRGYKTVLHTFSHGIGGHGGTGGNGGNSGKGGNGGLASNIYINTPEQFEKRVHRTSLDSEPGMGGLGGSGGAGGKPGTNGSSTEDNFPAPAREQGNRGADGNRGRDGSRGKSRGAAKMFLNERL